MDIDVSVVVPTFRECENLRVLLPRIDHSLREAGLHYELIIVDDDSRDGTEELAAELSHEYPIRLIVRRNERGLAGAVVAGMNEAQGDVLVSINADLSHPPEKIPEIVAALGDPDVDFAIGSRYVPGAVISEQWSSWRRLISRVATALARPLTSAKDPLSGFYGLRRTTFHAAAPRHSLGFKIGLELMVRGRCKRIADIPITFSDRLHGKSKMRTRHMALYIVQIAVLALDLQRNRPAKTPTPQTRP